MKVREIQPGQPRTYQGVHVKVWRERGKASAHRCDLCGRPAQEWAYSGMDPDEYETTDKGGILVSADSGYYVPLCVPCHRVYDHQRSRVRAASI